jgi:hypothetical protein
MSLTYLLQAESCWQRVEKSHEPPSKIAHKGSTRSYETHELLLTIKQPENPNRYGRGPPSKKRKFKDDDSEDTELRPVIRKLSGAHKCLRQYLARSPQAGKERRQSEEAAREDMGELVSGPSRVYARR